MDVENLADRHTGAEEAIETREKRNKLQTILLQMSEKRRVVFTLFEVEGYSGEEIADILDVPLNTVWTRLYHARKEFFEQLAHRDRAAGESKSCNR
jgi:RNA polymerase sigma-70 factor (ECF subfamily)